MFDDYGFPTVDPDLRVCAGCFADEGLKAYVKAHADSQECSFCGGTSDDVIAAPLDQMVEHMQGCLSRDYSDPDNAGMVYETREGGYQGTVWDTEDFLLWEVGLELPRDDDNKLFEAICGGFGDGLWCSAHLYALGPDEALIYSWRTFCSLVKYQSRFFFRERPPRDEDDRELLHPARLLNVIVSYALASGLTKTLPKGTGFYRARFQPKGTTLTAPHELGPPPKERAAQNRMSPAGIVMIYVSQDVETAIDETANTPGTYAIGEFHTQRDITILDLAELPPVISRFAEISDSAEHDPREMLLFLHRLARDISRPIVRDDRVHIEYVPTQVVTEFLRFAATEDGRSFDGIRYRSSRKGDGMSLVLFADTMNIVDAWTEAWRKPKSDEWLELVAHNEVAVDQNRIDEISAIATNTEKDED